MLKIKLINLSCLELLLLLLLPWSLVCGNIFPLSSIRLPMALLFLLSFDHKPDLSLIEKLINLNCLKLLLLAPLLPVTPSCSFSLMPGSSICVYYAYA